MAEGDMNASKSWQEVLDNLLFTGSKDGTLENIENLRSEEELIRYFADDYYKNEIIKWMANKYTSSSWRKCKKKAKLLREDGNMKFKLKDYVSCLSIYTESIKYAPVESEELSLSFANRSAVLFHMNNYEAAIIDIELAFAHKYPQHLMYKLYQRKAECLVEQKKYQNAVSEFSHAHNLLQTMEDMPEEKRSSISKSIENAICDAMAHLTTSSHSGDPNIPDGDTNMPRYPVPLEGLNDDFPYASKCVSLRENKEKGRHVVALCDMSVGDILFVEKPFASVLLPENYQDRCHHCCNSLQVPIPCWECTTVLYCSVSCRKDSWNEYHEWECSGGLDIIHCVGIAHLGLRVVLKAGSISELKVLKKRLEKNDTNKNEPYFAVYNLMTHLENMNAHDRAAYALTAVCLMLYLDHHTVYFCQNTANTISNDVAAADEDDSLLLGCLILHHICQLTCNGHAITAIQEGKSCEENPVVEEQQIRIATAIFSSASMMNHSCDSNIINSFLGTSLIVRAYRDIQKGQEIFNCYGPHFKRMSKEHRKEILKSQYYFECQCKSCSNDDEFMKHTAFLCENCGGPIPTKLFTASQVKCSSCGSAYESSALLADSLRAQYAFEKGRELMDSGSFKEAIHSLQACHEIHVTCLYKSHTVRRSCLDSIAKCYAELGDFCNATIYIEKTLPAIEEQFGEWSIEMAHELSKLTDSMVGELISLHTNKKAFMKKHAETMKYVHTAKEIFQLHYGTWNVAFQDIANKESCLNQMLESVI